ncbi:MAG: MBL fold metallo-hydrolase [Nostoc sp.]|uniref:MBL fold metallo-hydrolase n=1 Tax=Nostoc sp. TaxID=1180 RepID=UPI002FFC903A
MQLEKIVDEAIAIETKPHNTIVYLSSGQCLHVQKAVLALGNFPAILPAPLAVLDNRYVKDAWSADAIATPGHTDSHMAYLVNDTHLLTGDALFIGGCGRTDFQSGDAGSLYDAVTQKLFTLPDDTLVYPGHDYQGQTVSTIGEEKHWNPRFAGRSRNQFIELMKNLNLPQPKKMLEAVPANQNCGRVLVAWDYQI